MFWERRYAVTRVADPCLTRANAASEASQRPKRRCYAVTHRPNTALTRGNTGSGTPYAGSRCYGRPIRTYAPSTRPSTVVTATLRTFVLVNSMFGSLIGAVTTPDRATYAPTHLVRASCRYTRPAHAIGRYERQFGVLNARRYATARGVVSDASLRHRARCARVNEWSPAGSTISLPDPGAGVATSPTGDAGAGFLAE